MLPQVMCLKGLIAPDKVRENQVLDSHPNFREKKVSCWVDFIFLFLGI